MYGFIHNSQVYFDICEPRYLSSLDGDCQQWLFLYLYCIVLYCIMRPYTDGPIGPLSGMLHVLPMRCYVVILSISVDINTYPGI